MGESRMMKEEEKRGRERNTKYIERKLKMRNVYARKF